MDANFWNERYAGAELIWTDRPNVFVARETAGLAPGTVLDLAAGEARNAIWLAERGWTATAADFSTVGLEKGRILAAQRGVDVAFVEIDATTFTPETTYDLVMVIYLQLPPEGRSAALDRALASVAPGGHVLVVAHDADNLTRGIGGPQDPNLLYSVSEVADRAVAAGFDVLVAEQARRSVETADGPRDAIDTVVHARR
jgi:SAM-dependent methyltransferase